jgi:glycogen debranching enzyme
MTTGRRKLQECKFADRVSNFQARNLEAANEERNIKFQTATIASGAFRKAFVSNFALGISYFIPGFAVSQVAVSQVEVSHFNLPYFDLPYSDLCPYTSKMSLFNIETNRNFAPHNQQEWLITNGLGGYAASTVLGMNTRRYHGLLIAAMNPPVGRVMTVNRIGEMLCLDGNNDRLLELGINTFRGSLHPRGDQYLTKFELGDDARWEYEVQGVWVVKELQLQWMANITAVRYTIDPGVNANGDGRAFKLMLQPFASLRDFHWLREAGSAHFRVQSSDRSVTIGEGPNEVTICADAGKFTEEPNWWYGHVYPVDGERGQGDQEDLFTPGIFVVEGNSKLTITLWMGIPPFKPGNFPGIWAGGEKRPAIAAKSPTIQKLMRAANDFVVFRKSPDGKPGTSVIAGYPWFSDWGRDTMISLPGLLLETGRFEQAKQVLCVFAQYVSQGMIPNVFGDNDSHPEYNTVDASLWFIHAAFEYLDKSSDAGTFEKFLHPACVKIIEGYRNGTRYHIHMDPADSLISQGDPQTQLTWMDARCNGVTFTPRQGKPVEINALWYHALVLMGMKDLAAKVKASFQKAFWVSIAQGLADVVDGDHRDLSIRPNQIFAVSLPNSPLTSQQQAAVVDLVQRELLTPMGLRTLSRNDPGYRGYYTGDQFNRDGAYHNGTVWPWLIGGFLEAYLKVNNRSAASIVQVKQWLAPLLDHMETQGAIGQIAEICDGEAPHRSVGCPAQAWSVAEVLRIAVMVGM